MKGRFRMYINIGEGLSGLLANGGMAGVGWASQVEHKRAWAVARNWTVRAGTDRKLELPRCGPPCSASSGGAGGG